MLRSRIILCFFMRNMFVWAYLFMDSVIRSAQYLEFIYVDI